MRKMAHQPQELQVPQGDHKFLEDSGDSLEISIIQMREMAWRHF